MPASLLPTDSPAARSCRELLADPPSEPGLPSARILVEYLLGRRAGELDVSGRSTDGSTLDAEAGAESGREIVLVDDPYGLQSELLSRLATVSAYNDRLDDARTVAAKAPAVTVLEKLGSVVGPDRDAADPDSGGDSTPGGDRGDGRPDRWAMVNAPKAVNALAETVARLQSQVSVFIVIGRSDAMSRAVNKELARGFARVDVSPGIGKYRLIIGSRPLRSPSPMGFPKHGIIDHPAVGALEVRAHGACFSGARSDEGSALLLDSLAAEVGAGSRTGAPNSVLDLGCGNGWLLTAAMTLTSAAKGVGTDVSRAAVASARETAAANGVDVDILLHDATTESGAVTSGAAMSDPGAEIPGEFDLILLNPPFHQGTAIETDTAGAMMRLAARYLAPEGRVFTVFNSHLRYRDRLEMLIGPSSQAGRNQKFTVVVSRYPGA